MPSTCHSDSTLPSASSLIVVSNRLPFVLKRKEDGTLYRTSSAGGLVTAVAPVMVQSKGLWIGWPGTYLAEEEKVPESDPDDVSPTAGLKSRQIWPVNLDKDDYDAYYNGCCNATFWPLFHSMPDRAVFEKNFWVAYKRVNENFSQIVLKALRKINKEKPDQVPIVWIHDYHLMLAANTIRQVADEENLQCKLGYFLHIPFPSWDIVKIFPWHDMILQGILACDLVGFHTNDYCVNFIDCCQRGLGTRVDRRAMLCEHGGRSVRVRALPIGIPFEHFESLARSAPLNSISTEDIKIILGVDRLDYTKGISKRFLAYKRLLEENPKYIERVLFLQIAVPSRTDVKEYQDLKEEIDKLVGMINGKFSTSKWSPVRYIYGQISQIELAGFYRDADVAFVTPLRDGMNLVAKEFVACRVAKPGVLILSPFAGAGEMMHEAIRVNPYEIENVSKELDRALTMPDEEREVRMNALRAREKVTNVDYWMRQFLTNIGTLIQEDGEDLLPTTVQPLSVEDFNSYLSPYVGDRALLALLLDYDGTLTPIAPTPAMAKIPTETKNLLERLSNHPDVFIAVVSGRSVQDVKSMVGIEGITYAGNHGLEILHNDGSKFVHPMPDEHQEQLARMMKQLHEQVCQDGAWVENKGVLLTYHYRKVPLEKRSSLVSRARELVAKFGFKIGEARFALEIKPHNVNWDKGRASIHILRTAFGVDWSDRVRILFAGDDVTDEDAMKALKGMAISFRIDTNHMTKTMADKRLPSTDSVVTLLRWVERHMSTRKPNPETSSRRKYSPKSQQIPSTLSIVTLPA